MLESKYGPWWIINIKNLEPTTLYFYEQNTNLYWENTWKYQNIETQPMLLPANLKVELLSINLYKFNTVPLLKY